MENNGSLLGGITSGAVGGATLGSVGGPAGAVGGGIVGAIASGASALFKAKEDEKRRQLEVQRTQLREDNAVRRAVADSLASGLDPRSLDRPVNPANAQSIAPYEQTDQLGNIADTFTSSANVLNNRFINESKIQDSAINSLTDAYKERKVAAQNGLNVTDTQIEKWYDDFKELTINESDTEKAFSTRIISESKDLVRKLNSAKVDATWKKEVLDRTLEKGGHKDTEGTKFGGGGDYLTAAMAIVDNIKEQQEQTKKSSGEKIVPPPAENKPSASTEPKKRLVWTNPETGTKYYPKKEGNYYSDKSWNGPRTQDGRPAYVDKGGQTRPLEQSFEVEKPSPQKENKPSKITTKDEFTAKGTKDGKKETNKKGKDKKLRLSGERSDGSEDWTSDEDEDATTDTTGGLVSFSNEEITEIVKAWQTEQFGLAREKSKNEFHTYDFESKLAKFENLTKLYLKRQDFLDEYKRSPMEFFEENYNTAYEFYRKLYSPYKFFRK